MGTTDVSEVGTQQLDISILDRAIVDSRRGLPLHLQVRQTLRSLIDQHFADGQILWPEKMIAEHLGVSRGTVRLAILELTREGLIRRHHARGSFIIKDAVQQTRLSTVGIFLSHYESDFLSQMLTHIAWACRESGLRLELYDTQQGEKTAHAYREVERPASEQGIILMIEPRAEVELYAAFHERGYRVVSVESTSSQYHGPAVSTDGAMAIRLGIDHLHALGHRHIVLLVNEPDEAPTVKVKIDAFKAITSERGMTEARIVMCGTHHWQSSYEAAYAHMGEAWDLAPTALFTVSDPGAWAALRWFAEHGINVPRQVSVLGYEDVRPSRFMFPALTTIAHPIPELAKEAVRILTDGLSVRKLLPPRLVIRESTAEAPHS
jgi:LacI family transcriptional regulator